MLTIAVCDDESSQRDLICQMLRSDLERRPGLAAKIRTFSSGQELLSAVKETGEFDLYLLDIIMPVINGFGVLDYMKKKGLLDRLPVVIVTDDDSEETSDRAYEYKVADIVIKPFEPKIIRRRVQNIIDLYTYREKYGKKI